jgi:hypothetical protein
MMEELKEKGVVLWSMFAERRGTNSLESTVQP